MHELNSVDHLNKYSVNNEETFPLDRTLVFFLFLSEKIMADAIFCCADPLATQTKLKCKQSSVLKVEIQSYVMA